MNIHWGVWHPSNTTSRHVKDCFYITYESNLYGARDEERLLESNDERIIVLGDSFIEGFGIDTEVRLSNVLEYETGIPHLNFGTAGNFGPTQYSLLYQHLAKEFSHSAILIGILPANDFYDDDYEYGKLYHHNRYRPYLVGTSPDYTLIYHQDILKLSSWHLSRFEREQNEADILHNSRSFLRRYSYIYINLSNLKQIFFRSLSEKNLHSNDQMSSAYYEYDVQGLLKWKYSLEKIIQLADDRPVYVFTIPILNDLERFHKDQNAPLSQAMKNLSEEIGIEYIDLLPVMYHETKDLDAYYLSCDGHWNDYGNQIAAKILMQKLSLYR